MFDESESTIKEYQKSQNVRLYDIVLLGPFLLYIALKKGRLTQLDKIAVGLIAVGTIIYNGRNYLNNKNESNR